MNIFLPLLLLTFSLPCLSARVQYLPSTPLEADQLLLKFTNKNDSPAFLALLRKQTMATGAQAVPILAQVMKGEQFSDKKRWLATFTLGRIMGKKSLRFISKFTQHPNWILRLAGLKTLLALRDKNSKEYYLDALKDTSLIVRLQALENIRALEIKEYGRNVWEMLFHKHNYQGKKGQRKRTTVIAKAIRTVGDLQYRPVRQALLKLIQSPKYTDLVIDIDYALRKITGIKSPQTHSKKIQFWKSQ